jgi:hypothetical protein
MKKFYSLVFKSIVDKGEEFTFGDLLKLDANQQIINEFVELLVETQKEEIRNSIKVELQEK